MTIVAKMLSSVFLSLIVIICFVTGDAREAFAGTTTITCSVAGFNSAQNNTLTYDHSAGTCTMASNTISPSTAQFDIVFFNQRGGNEEFRIGSGTGHNNNTHKGCTMGAFTAAAGINCASNRTSPAATVAESATVTIDGPNGATIRMNISYTLAPSDSFTYNSASVTITTPDAAGSGRSATTQRAVQGSVTRSQSVVLGQNFGSRVANVATGAPGGGVPAGTVPEATPQSQQPGFASTSFWDDRRNQKSTSLGTSLRGLAMFASFDTSHTLSAAQNADQPTEGTGQRTFLNSGSDFTIWGHGSFTDIENKRNRSGEDSRYDGSVWGYNLGADYRVSPELVAGLAIGYAQTDIVTTFESGTYEEDSWNVSPYVIYTPSDTLTFSAITGYAFGDVSRSRNSNVTANTDSRSFYLQLDGRQTFQPITESAVRISAGLGALLSRNTLSAYTESDGTRVGETSVNTIQMKPNAELAYPTAIAGSQLEPYVKAAYIHDFTDQTNGDAGAFDLGGGLRFTAGNTGLSGSIEGSRLFGRDDYDEYTVGGLVAYGFSFTGKDLGFAGFVAPYLGTNLSENGVPELSAGATLGDIDDRIAGKLNFSGNPGAGSADVMIMVDIKF
jgi:Tfp pilus assembly major pilin PilA